MTGPATGSNSIRRVDIINPAQLRQDAYFESLVQEAYQAGAISDESLQRIQMECLELLAEKTRKFTSGASSVRVEDAESIMKSNLYTISLFLKSVPGNHDAIEAIKTTPVSELYAMGQKRLKIVCASTMYLYRCVLRNMVGVDYYYYFSTLTKTMEQFFASYTDYYMLYNAHELPGDATWPTQQLNEKEQEVLPTIFSYPLCNPGQTVEKLAGIEYVRGYLQVIYYENEFCKRFTDEAILDVLLSYNTDYNEIVFNIFEKVIIKAMGCAIVGADAAQLQIPDDCLGMLRGVLGRGADDEKRRLLAGACQRMIDELGIENPAVQGYVMGAVLKLML